jgi:hypothetical protein
MTVVDLDLRDSALDQWYGPVDPEFPAWIGARRSGQRLQ